MTRVFEIVDEAGNVHGPFATREQIDSYVADRGLGEERDLESDSERGWYMQVAKTAP